MPVARCECGAVELRIEGELRSTIACHCGQCRRMSGHYWAATAARVDQIKVNGEENLAWYVSSDIARRGFCRVCGSSMIYHRNAANYWAIASGCIEGDAPKLAEHIFVDDKGSYYEIADGLPQHPGSGM